MLQKSNVQLKFEQQCKQELRLIKAPVILNLLSQINQNVNDKAISAVSQKAHIGRQLTKIQNFKCQNSNEKFQLQQIIMLLQKVHLDKHLYDVFRLELNDFLETIDQQEKLIQNIKQQQQLISFTNPPESPDIKQKPSIQKWQSPQAILQKLRKISQLGRKVEANNQSNDYNNLSQEQYTKQIEQLTEQFQNIDEPIRSSSQVDVQQLVDGYNNAILNISQNSPLTKALQQSPTAETRHQKSNTHNELHQLPNQKLEGNLETSIKEDQSKQIINRLMTDQEVENLNKSQKNLLKNKLLQLKEQIAQKRQVESLLNYKPIRADVDDRTLSDEDGIDLTFLDHDDQEKQQSKQRLQNIEQQLGLGCQKISKQQVNQTVSSVNQLGQLQDLNISDQQLDDKLRDSQLLLQSQIMQQQNMYQQEMKSNVQTNTTQNASFSLHNKSPSNQLNLQQPQTVCERQQLQQDFDKLKEFETRNKYVLAFKESIKSGNMGIIQKLIVEKQEPLYSRCESFNLMASQQIGMEISQIHANLRNELETRKIYYLQQKEYVIMIKQRKQAKINELLSNIKQNYVSQKLDFPKYVEIYSEKLQQLKAQFNLIKFYCKTELQQKMIRMLKIYNKLAKYE